jgi:hypothetical protein
VVEKKQRYTASVGVLETERERERERERDKERHNRLEALIYGAPEEDKRGHKATEEVVWQETKRDSENVRAATTSRLVATLLSGTVIRIWHKHRLY